MEQMWGAVGAVFGSWKNDRAIVYRRQYGIPHEWGTAANVCSMVFGNMGDDCGTGVAFTRDPATGEKVFYGEYLINAQGEDVVAGIRTPKKIAELQKDMPAVYKQLDEIRRKLEKHYRDVQDIEFTIQKGKLWMLQTRNGKRTGFAAVRIAVDMVEEGLITQGRGAVGRPHPAGRPEPAPAADLRPGRRSARQRRAAAGQGHQRRPRRGDRAASSSSPTTPRPTSHKHGKGRPRRRSVILVRRETSPEDLRGMQAADGILTAFGGAQLARGPRQPADGQGLHRRLPARCRSTTTSGTVTVGDKVLKEGDFITHRRLHRRSHGRARSPPSPARSSRC